MMRKIFSLALLLAVWAFAAGAQQEMTLEERVSALEAAQEGTPSHHFTVTGYANVSYVTTEEGESTFSTLFAPIFLFKAGDRVLFEGELEFELDGDETEVGFEYAQLDYMFSDNAVLVAGKMLLPLGIFGERIHPSWINKMPFAPIIYAGHGGSPVGLIPVMSDFGVQLRGGFLTGGLRWNYATYLVNGPRAVEAEPEMGHGEEEGGHGSEAPINYAANSEDDNNNKAYGGRIGVLPGSGLEIGLSYYSGGVTYNKFVDETSDPGEKKENPVTLTMVDITYQRGAFRLQGEYLLEDTNAIDEYALEVEDDDDTPLVEEASEEVHIPGERTGYWLEVSHAFGGIIPEVVLRYGATTADGEELGNQTALGFNWWLESSLVLKLAAVTNSIEEEGGGSETTTDYHVALAMGF